MSTLVTEERRAGVAIWTLSILARLVRWYREAVTEPTSEREKADWQQNSF